VKLTFRPIDSWPRPETDPRHGFARFKASYSDTLSLLDRELRLIGAQSAVLMVDATERECRLDGQLRADARLSSPRVILAFESKHGALKYYCDQYTKWQTNLRAIALGLEALRKVERYGIASRGEQYRGYTALPSGIALGPSSMSRRDAAELLIRTAGFQWHGGKFDDCVDNLLEDTEFVLPDVWRAAVKVAHPDTGGDTEAFKTLSHARTVVAA
jgi:hypothetical protein